LNFIDTNGSILCLLLCYIGLSLLKLLSNFPVAKVYPAHFDLIGMAHMYRQRIFPTEASTMSLHSSRWAPMAPGEPPCLHGEPPWLHGEPLYGSTMSIMAPQ
jgi:hypothetical protein